MSATRGIAIRAVAAILLLLNGARAATTNTKLSISGCPAATVSADRLFEMARTELAPRTLTVGEETIDATTVQLHVELCQGSGDRVMLQLFDHGELRTLRQVDLSDVPPDLRPRTLAVALAELLAAVPERDGLAHTDLPSRNAAPGIVAGPSAIDAPSNQLTAVPALESKAPPVFLASPRDTNEPDTFGHHKAITPPRLSMGGALREFVSPQTTLVGPWFGFGWRRLGGEAQLLSNRQDTALGSIALYDVNLAAMYEMLSFGSKLVTSAHLRAEIGQIWARGRADPGARVAGNSDRVTHLAAALDVEFEAALQRHWGLNLHLQAGIARGVAARVDGQTIANTQGAFLGASLGLSYALSI